MQTHRLSLRLAWRVAVSTAAVFALLALAGGGWMQWAVLGAPLAIGTSTYFVARKLLAKRIDLAQHSLQRIHASDFSLLDTAGPDDNDEFSRLLMQIHTTGHEVKKQIQELERMETYRRDFLGNVSHELRTPIFSIKGFAETLLSGALQDPDVRRPFVEKIQRNAQRLENLAVDLGEVARIESGELAMKHQPFNLRHVAERVLESLEGLASSMQVTIRQHMPNDLPPVVGDGDRIGQVLGNLVDNAIKYNRSGGLVEIVARHMPDGLIAIHVVDNGIGIAPEHIDRLTERFYRVDSSRSRSLGGTGLGLAIVKHILGAHGSQMRVESNLGGGSTFGFTLPSASET